MQTSKLPRWSIAAALMLAPALGHARHRHRYEDDSQPPAQTSPQSPNADNRGNDWGVGFAYLPGPGGALNAMTGTYRLHNLSLDGLLLGGTSSVYDGSTNAAGQMVNNGVSDFGLGAQARYDVLHPTRWLAMQAVGRLSYVTQSNTGYVLGNSRTQNAGMFGLFLGAGFEGFIPAWKAVSIEVNSGLNFALTNSNAGSTSTNGSSVFLGASNANAFVPFNLAVHYYF